MEGKRFIHTLRLKNLLSYGSEGEEIELQPLNVLIGANASGKSNLIEAIRLLRGTCHKPQDLNSLIYTGGGVSEWLWKGEKDIPIAKIEAILDSPWGTMPLRYQLSFTMRNQVLAITDEVIENEQPSFPGDFFYRFQNGSPVVNAITPTEPPASTSVTRTSIPLNSATHGFGGFNYSQSILSQIREPYQYPEITYLGYSFPMICFYRLWNITPYTPPRQPLKLDSAVAALAEDGSNLALVINDLQYRLGNQSFIQEIVEKLKKIYPQVTDISLKIEGGTIQIFLREQYLSQPIPATRLSDGTIRYLCLLALLCHPILPPLICLEEPEIGLHPDMMSTIADLLIEASQRTQLIVTTHSEALVSSLPPESVVVCERDDLGTHLRRLDPERLKKWLEDYSLGELWSMGEIGGTQW
ncbi:MAG TPA: chromosome segregation protein SMC [Cyanobacteria bacterium UBA12227]|nr:chromosome segregation protein SMC [Cyanobacteria bacterium UBA12227]HAX89263.1 chromosome segregation protein SMC [Cyanobacteria bacterium UBA11370]HBY79253.1 chromosome segregation protein SMC [Cyanobacteria bacterium UBA11148]